MILRIDHVGLVTDNSDGVGDLLARLGLRRTDGGLADGYGAACEFWQLPGGGGDAPSIEVNSPAGNGSVLKGLLERNGPGLYHIALEVDDLEGELTRLRSRGFLAIDEEPQAGARPGMRVAFLYVRKPVGILIELVQYEREVTSPPAED